MAYIGQEYKQGIVIQRSNKGSAFQEEINGKIDAEGAFEPKVPGGFKKVDVETTIEAGKPVAVNELPEAAEEYEGLVYKVEDTMYICVEDDETYAWKELEIKAEVEEEPGE